MSMDIPTPPMNLRGKINELFCLENATKLTNFCTKSHVSILINFLDKMAHLFSLKMEALRSESFKQSSTKTCNYI